MNKKILLVFILSLAIILSLWTGCTSSPSTSPAPKPSPEDTGSDIEKESPEALKDPEAEEEKQNEKEEEREDKDPPYLTQEELEKIQPNELGEIMILMYHEIGDREDTWERHYDNFKKDLERLYEKGYRPINLNDLIDNNIDIEAGHTPVVLTFDDSTAGQFRYLEEKEELIIDPHCAVGIMKDFNEKNPDFEMKGTFYTIYSAPPFRQGNLVQEKMDFIIDKGMEIGNHTYNHVNLASADTKTMEKELARHVKKTREYLPGYQVRSLALPYGGIPSTPEEPYLYSGEYQGTSYKNEAILLVGSNPAPSPHHKNFNLNRLPRIRGSQEQLDQWFDYFERYPERRYVSDGNPDTVAIPENLKENLKEENIKEKEIRTYSLTGSD